jgi:acyl-CoA synthetase (NDP forming)
LLSDHGIPLAEFSAETAAALKEIFPIGMHPTHPVDLWPAVELNGLETVYGRAVEALMRDPRVDSIIVETIAWQLATPDYLVKIAELKRLYNKPVALWMIGASEMQEEYRRIVEEAGLPVFTEIQRCVAFIAAVRKHFKKKRALGLI